MHRCGFAVFGGQKNPRGHGLIKLQPFLLSVSLQLDGYMPDGTSMHVIVLFEYFPCSHMLHPVEPFIGAMFPGEQSLQDALP